MNDWKVVSLTFLVTFLIVIALGELFIWTVSR